MKSTIIHRRPKLWRIIKIFNKNYDPERTSLAFGGTIYTERHLGPSDLTHEEVHCRQMRYSKLIGVVHFVRFHFSKSFRFRMELEAFRAQYQFLVDLAPGSKNRTAHILARELSGPLYGRLCTLEEARRAIIK